MKQPWEVRKQLYVDSGRPLDQSFEDMLSRRILKALKLNGKGEKVLNNTELTLFDYNYVNDTLWVRASRIFTELMRRKPHTSELISNWTLDTAQVTNDYQALDRLVCGNSDTSLGVLFTMPKVDPSKYDGSVYVTWYKNTPMDIITAPYKVLSHTDMPEYRFTVQSVSEFIKQFNLTNE